MKTKNMLTAGLVAVMIMLESSSAVLAAQDTSLDPDLIAEKHEQVRQAILSGNFSAWYSLLTENGKTPKILEIITEDKFAKFSEAIKTLDELGLKGPGVGMGMNMRAMRHEMDGGPSGPMELGLDKKFMVKKWMKKGIKRGQNGNATITDTAE